MSAIVAPTTNPAAAVLALPPRPRRGRRAAYLVNFGRTTRAAYSRQKNAVPPEVKFDRDPRGFVKRSLHEREIELWALECASNFPAVQLTAQMTKPFPPQPLVLSASLN